MNEIKLEILFKTKSKKSLKFQSFSQNFHRNSVFLFSRRTFFRKSQPIIFLRFDFFFSTKQNKTKQNKTKENKTKQNKMGNNQTKTKRIEEEINTMTSLSTNFQPSENNPWIEKIKNKTTLK